MRLDAILYDGFAELRAARRAEDARITAWVGNLTDTSGTLRYRTMSNPRDIEQPLAPALDHFFNHQTHHRGQAHTILCGFGRRGLVLDLLFFQREAEAGKA